ncbi:PH domain-containing protein [Moraxella bovoculi]|uniref:PH domain-containing protein n=1 Tax=Moraxella bovoculi TaxID=386891 RepID=UPI00062455CC|nr:PH domain-containing protein [Moraxella bovoculi]AKG12188.1 membrane protein [Moraxella bovoculi]AKG14160.1 membrane protein [Moraxella bovoculi]
MSGYIDNNLTNNERVILRAKVSWWSQIWMFLFGAILLAAYGLGLILIIVAVLRVMTTELALTNKRVIAKTGFIRRDTVELRLDRVEGLIVNQGIVGRILNYGTVLVTGTGGIKTPIPYISKPTDFRRVVNEYLEDPSQFDEE